MSLKPPDRLLEAYTRACEAANIDPDADIVRHFQSLIREKGSSKGINENDLEGFVSLDSEIDKYRNLEEYYRVDSGIGLTRTEKEIEINRASTVISFLSLLAAAWKRFWEDTKACANPIQSGELSRVLHGLGGGEFIGEDGIPMTFTSERRYPRIRYVHLVECVLFKEALIEGSAIIARSLKTDKVIQTCSVVFSVSDALKALIAAVCQIAGEVDYIGLSSELYKEVRKVSDNLELISSRLKAILDSCVLLETPFSLSSKALESLPSVATAYQSDVSLKTVLQLIDESIKPSRESLVAKITSMCKGASTGRHSTYNAQAPAVVESLLMFKDLLLVRSIASAVQEPLMELVGSLETSIPLIQKELEIAYTQAVRESGGGQLGLAGSVVGGSMSDGYVYALTCANNVAQTVTSLSKFTAVLRKMPGLEITQRIKGLEDSTSSLESKATKARQQLVKHWSDRVIGLIGQLETGGTSGAGGRNGYVTLAANSAPILSWEPGTGRLVVGQSTAVLPILRYVRVLTAMGQQSSISSRVKALCQSLSSKARSVEMLQQTASFYNGLATRLHFAHVPFLLEPSVRFERAVRDASRVKISARDLLSMGDDNTGTAAQAVTLFTSTARDIFAELQRLKKVVDGIDTVHTRFASFLAKLPSLPFKQRSSSPNGPESWFAIINELREETSRLLAGRHPLLSSVGETSGDNWVVFWNTQILHLFSSEWVRRIQVEGIPSIYDSGTGGNSPELQQGSQSNSDDEVVSVSLKVSSMSGDIEFDPPLDVIRELLYNQLSSVLSLPASPKLFSIDPTQGESKSSKEDLFAYVEQQFADLADSSPNLQSSFVARIEVFLAKLNAVKATLKQEVAVSLIGDAELSAMAEKVTPSVIKEAFDHIKDIEEAPSFSVATIPELIRRPGSQGASYGSNYFIPPMLSVELDLSDVVGHIRDQPALAKKVLLRTVRTLVGRETHEMDDTLSSCLRLLTSSTNQVGGIDEVKRSSKVLRDVQDKLDETNTKQRMQQLDELLDVVQHLGGETSTVTSSVFGLLDARTVAGTEALIRSVQEKYGMLVEAIQDKEQLIRSKKATAVEEIVQKLLGRDATSLTSTNATQNGDTKPPKIEGFVGKVRELSGSFNGSLKDLFKAFSDAHTLTVHKEACGGDVKTRTHLFVWTEQLTSFHKLMVALAIGLTRIQKFLREIVEISGETDPQGVIKRLVSKDMASAFAATLSGIGRYTAAAAAVVAAFQFLESHETTTLTEVSEEWTYIRTKLYIVNDIVTELENAQAEASDETKIIERARALLTGLVEEGKVEVPEGLAIVGIIPIDSLDTKVLGSIRKLAGRFSKLKNHLETSLPVLRLLRSDALSDAHWKMIQKLCQPQRASRDDFLLPSLLRKRDGAPLLLFDLLDPSLPSVLAPLANIVQEAEGGKAVREAVREASDWLSECTVMMKLATLTPTAKEFFTNIGRNRSAQDTNRPFSIPICCSFSAVLVGIKEQKAIIDSVKTSQYFNVVAKEAATLLSDFDTLNTIILLINDNQTLFLNLEPVIGHRVLANIDTFYTATTPFVRALFGLAGDSLETELSSAKPVVRLLRSGEDRLEDKLRESLRVMLETRRALLKYLEGKRLKFARFFFLSDTDLLDILANATHSPASVNRYITKMYQGIDKLEMAPAEGGKHVIKSFSSAEREIVVLSTPVPVTGEPEDWLTNLDHEIVTTIRRLTFELLGKNQLLGTSNTTQTGKGQKLKMRDFQSLIQAALDSSTQDLPKFISLDFPSQALNLVNDILFSSIIAEAFRSSKENNDIKKRLEFASAYIQSLKAKLRRATSNCGALESLKGQSLLTSLSRQESFVATALELKQAHDEAASQSNFARSHKFLYSQFMKHFVVGSTVIVKCLDVKIPYGFQYNNPHRGLIYTSLTYKSLLSNAIAFRGFIGMSIGPAGTGKTESVKELCAAIGTETVVFNCDSGIDSISIGRVVAGVLVGGLVGCLDEFNRLSANVLNEMSSLLEMVRLKKEGRYEDPIIVKCKAESDNDNEDENEEGDGDGGINKAEPLNDIVIKTIDPASVLFLTMNPASKDYKGRSELPHSLTSILKTVEMECSPDTVSLIIVSILLINGFRHGADIGGRCSEVYRRCKEQLGSSYDWGLRALNGVFSFASLLLDASAQRDQQTTGSKRLVEEALIMVRSLKQATVPRLTPADLPTFNTILYDVFSDVLNTVAPSHNDFVGLQLPELDVERDLVMCLRKAAKEMQYTVNGAQLDYCLYLFNNLINSIGVTLVGEQGSGKTACFLLLLRAIEIVSAHRIRCVVHHIAPKSMAGDILLGTVNKSSREWLEGILTSACKVAVGGDQQEAGGDDTQTTNETERFLTAVVADKIQVLSSDCQLFSGLRGEQNRQQEWHFIMLDGTVDPVWIEALNSVLDDNRTLSLANGERIKFGTGNINPLRDIHIGKCVLDDKTVNLLRLPSSYKVKINSERTKILLSDKGGTDTILTQEACPELFSQGSVVATPINFVFETSEMRHASPATISRMRIINIVPTFDQLVPLLSMAAPTVRYTDLLVDNILGHNLSAPTQPFTQPKLDNDLRSIIQSTITVLRASRNNIISGEALYGPEYSIDDVIRHITQNAINIGLAATCDHEATPNIYTPPNTLSPKSQRLKKVVLFSRALAASLPPKHQGTIQRLILDDIGISYQNERSDNTVILHDVQNTDETVVVVKPPRHCVVLDGRPIVLTNTTVFFSSLLYAALNSKRPVIIAGYQMAGKTTITKLAIEEYNRRTASPGCNCNVTKLVQLMRPTRNGLVDLIKTHSKATTDMDTGAAVWTTNIVLLIPHAELLKLDEFGQSELLCALWGLVADGSVAVRINGRATKVRVEGVGLVICTSNVADFPHDRLRSRCCLINVPRLTDACCQEIVEGVASYYSVKGAGAFKLMNVSQKKGLQGGKASKDPRNTSSPTEEVVIQPQHECIKFIAKLFLSTVSLVAKDVVGTTYKSKTMAFNITTVLLALDTISRIDPTKQQDGNDNMSLLVDILLFTLSTVIPGVEANDTLASSIEQEAIKIVENIDPTIRERYESYRTSRLGANNQQELKSPAYLTLERQNNPTIFDYALDNVRPRLFSNISHMRRLVSERQGEGQDTKIIDDPPPDNTLRLTSADEFESQLSSVVDILGETQPLGSVSPDGVVQLMVTRNVVIITDVPSSVDSDLLVAACGLNSPLFTIVPGSNNVKQLVSTCCKANARAVLRVTDKAIAGGWWWEGEGATEEGAANESTCLVPDDTIMQPLVGIEKELVQAAKDVLEISRTKQPSLELADVVAVMKKRLERNCKVVFVFDRRNSAFLATVLAERPDIFDGCVVLDSARTQDTMQTVPYTVTAGNTVGSKEIRNQQQNQRVVVAQPKRTLPFTMFGVNPTNGRAYPTPRGLQQQMRAAIFGLGTIDRETRSVLSSIISGLLPKLHFPVSVFPPPYAAVLLAPLLVFQTHSLGVSSSRVSSGVEALQKFSTATQEIAASLTTTAKQLQGSQAECETAMEGIKRMLEDIAQRREAIGVIDKEVSARRASIEAEKTQVEKEMEDILPIVEEAKRRIDTLPKDAITEIKSFTMPPEQVSTVLEGVLILFGVTDTSWKRMRQFLMQPEFKSKLINFDIDSLSPKSLEVKRIKNLMAATPSAFDPDMIVKISRAAAPLSAWLRALVSYSSVAEKIKPYKDAIDKLSAGIQEQMNQMEALAKEMKEMEERTEKLKGEYQEKMKLVVRLGSELEEGNKKISIGHQLVELLGDERGRWCGNLDEIKIERTQLPQICALATAFVMSAGMLEDEKRNVFVKDWMETYGPIKTERENERDDPKQVRRLILKALAPKLTLSFWRHCGADSEMALENMAMLGHLLGWEECCWGDNYVRMYRKLHNTDTETTGDVGDVGEGLSKLQNVTSSKNKSLLSVSKLRPRGAAIVDNTGTAKKIINRRFQELEKWKRDNMCVGVKTQDNNQNYTRTTSLSLDEVSVRNSDVMSTIHVSMRFGHTLLVTDVEGTPVFLHGVASDSYGSYSGTKGIGARSLSLVPIPRTLDSSRVFTDEVIKTTVGNREADVHPEFRVILIKNTPGVSNSDLFTNISFLPTATSLSSMYTEMILNQYEPTLLNDITTLKTQIEDNKENLSRYEEQLLELLISCNPSDTLDNAVKAEDKSKPSLFKQLQTVKREVTVIRQSQDKITTSIEELSRKRATYAKVGDIAAALREVLSVVGEMGGVALDNNMVEFHLRRGFVCCGKEEDANKLTTSLLSFVVKAVLDEAVSCVGSKTVPVVLLTALHILRGDVFDGGYLDAVRLVIQDNSEDSVNQLSQVKQTGSTNAVLKNAKILNLTAIPSNRHSAVVRAFNFFIKRDKEVIADRATLPELIRVISDKGWDTLFPDSTAPNDKITICLGDKCSNPELNSLFYIPQHFRALLLIALYPTSVGTIVNSLFGHYYGTPPTPSIHNTTANALTSVLNRRACLASQQQTERTKLQLQPVRPILFLTTQDADPIVSFESVLRAAESKQIEAFNKGRLDINASPPVIHSISITSQLAVSGVLADIKELQTKQQLLNKSRGVTDVPVVVVLKNIHVQPDLTEHIIQHILADEYKRHTSGDKTRLTQGYVPPLMVMTAEADKRVPPSLQSVCIVHRVEAQQGSVVQGSGAALSIDVEWFVKSLRGNLDIINKAVDDFYVVNSSQESSGRQTQDTKSITLSAVLKIFMASVLQSLLNVRAKYPTRGLAQQATFGPTEALCVMKYLLRKVDKGRDASLDAMLSRFASNGVFGSVIKGDTHDIQLVDMLCSLFIDSCGDVDVRGKIINHKDVVGPRWDHMRMLVPLVRLCEFTFVSFFKDNSRVTMVGAEKTQSLSGADLKEGLSGLNECFITNLLSPKLQAKLSPNNSTVYPFGHPLSFSDLLEKESCSVTLRDLKVLLQRRSVLKDTSMGFGESSAASVAGRVASGNVGICLCVRGGRCAMVKLERDQVVVLLFNSLSKGNTQLQIQSIYLEDSVSSLVEDVTKEGSTFLCKNIRRDSNILCAELPVYKDQKRSGLVGVLHIPVYVCSEGAGCTIESSAFNKQIIQDSCNYNGCYSYIL